MKKVAYLCSLDTLSSSDIRRWDAYERDMSFRILHRAFMLLDRELVEVAWSNYTGSWTTFEAVLIGSTWDYTQDYTNFMRVLRRIANETRLFNSFDAVRWNSIKYYQKYLSNKGITTIPTLWPDDLEHMSPAAMFNFFGVDRLIAKPIIGACSERQIVFSQRDMPPFSRLVSEKFMIQAYYPHIQEVGEISLIYLAGIYSHSVLKVPAIDEYRVQGIFGGSETVFTPSQECLVAAQKILDATPYDLLYARVDLFRMPRGPLALMELEIIEPYLYLQFVPDHCARFMERYVAEIGNIHITKQHQRY